jgi:iron complex outermembrane receptor protein
MSAQTFAAGPHIAPFKRQTYKSKYSGGISMITSKPSISRKILLGAIATVLVYLPIQETLAQELEEIVVTSRRYEETITDAPVAVAVMNMDFLEDQKVDSIQDILELTPGATWDQFAAAQPGLSMRGIFGGTFGNASLESAVQVVYDGVPLTKAFMMTIPTYDLARVEVMRGPQGTTFGRNATLGLIHFISAKPSQESSGDIRATVGDPDLVGLSGHFNGGLSDTISGRIAFSYQDSDGNLEDTDTGKALEGAENTSIRASLLFEPSDSFNAYVKAEVINNDDMPQVRRGEGCVAPWLGGQFGGYTDDCTDWTARQDETRPLSVERDMFFLTAELTWALQNDLGITWVSGYQDGEHHSRQDAFGTPFALRDQDVDNDAEVLSTELRLDNHASGSGFRWLIGAAYTDDQELREELNVGMPERGGCGGRFVIGGKECPPWSLYQRADASNESFGLFGEIGIDLGERFILTLGARYSDESRDMVWRVDGWGEAGGLSGIGLGDPNRDCADPLNRFDDPDGRTKQNNNDLAVHCGTETNPVGFDAVASQSWDNTSVKATLQFALTDNSNIYLTYSEGYKAGGFQMDARNLDAFNIFIDPEEMENIELGWKGSYDRALFAVTVFSQELTNSQVGTQLAVGSGNANMIFNAKGVDSTGVELEGTFALTDNWQLGGSMGFYDVEFAPGSVSGATYNPLTGAIEPSGADISGERPNNSPEETWAIWTAYTLDFSGGSSLRFRADTTHRGDAWSRLNNREGRNIADTGFLNLRPELDKFGVDVSWTSPSNTMTVSVWGRNLDDTMDQLNPGPGVGYIFNLGAGDPGDVRDRDRPRGFAGRKQVGATFAYRF